MIKRLRNLKLHQNFINLLMLSLAFCFWVGCKQEAAKKDGGTTIPSPGGGTPAYGFSFADPVYTFVQGSSKEISIVPKYVNSVVPKSCVVAPALPAGLKIIDNCIITGKATGSLMPSTPYTVTGTYADGAPYTTKLNLQVVLYSFEFSKERYSFIVGSKIDPIIPTYNGLKPVSCSANLPSGLSLSNDCSMNGTPTVESSPASYKITGTYPDGPPFTTEIPIQVSQYQFSFDASPYYLDLNIKNTPISIKPKYKVINNTESIPNKCEVANQKELPAGLKLQDNCEINGVLNTSQAPSDSYDIIGSYKNGSHYTAHIDLNLVLNGISFDPTYSFKKGEKINGINPKYIGVKPASCTLLDPSQPLPKGFSVNPDCSLKVDSSLNTLIEPNKYILVAYYDKSRTFSMTSLSIEVAQPIYIGAPQAFGRAGAVFYCNLSNKKCTHFKSNEENPGESVFGTSIVKSGENLFVGAPGRGSGGHVYKCGLDGSSCARIKVNPNDGEKDSKNYQLGSYLSASKNNLYIAQSRSDFLQPDDNGNKLFISQCNPGGTVCNNLSFPGLPLGNPYSVLNLQTADDKFFDLAFSWTDNPDLNYAHFYHCEKDKPENSCTGMTKENYVFSFPHNETHYFIQNPDKKSLCKDNTIDNQAPQCSIQICDLKGTCEITYFTLDMPFPDDYDFINRFGTGIAIW